MNSIKLNSSFFLIQCTILLILHSFLLLFTESNLQLKLNLILQLLLIILAFYWSYKKSGTYLNAPFIFLITIFFWHTAFLLCYFFEISPMFKYTGSLFTYGFAFLHRSTALTAFCISFAILGIYIGYFKQNKIYSSEYSYIHDPLSEETNNNNFKLDYFKFSPYSNTLIYLALLSYFLITSLYFLKIGMGLFSYKYSGAFYLQQPDTFLFRFYQATKFFSIIVIITALAYSKTLNSSRLLILLFLILALGQFLMGSRSMPFMTIVALFICIDHFIKRQSLKTLLIFAVILAFLSTIVSIARSISGMGWNVFNFAATSRPLNLYFWQFIWDAQQQGIVLRTMQFISDKGDLFYGQSILDSIIYLFPRFIIDGLGFRTEFIDPSIWIVQNSPDVPLGGGMGYSLIAESYFNFGMFGFLLFALIGWFIGKHYFKYVYHKNIYSLLHALNFSIIFSLHMRNAIGTYMRYLFYGFIFIEILKYFDKIYYRKSLTGSK